MSAAEGRGGAGAVRMIGAGAAGVLVGALLVGGFYTAREPGRAEIEGVVREYVLANPEIIPQAIERLQQREAAAVVAQNREALETPFAGAWAGAEEGDVVLVEFFDYACGYCRASNPDVKRLLAEEPGLKVVWRELPVLGPDSGEAAVASLAAARRGQEAFQAFHGTLFELGRPTSANIAEAARKAGIGPAEIAAARSAPEIATELQRNMGLAQAIGASGTPTFVVGSQVLQGAVGYEVLKAALEQAREG